MSIKEIAAKNKEFNEWKKGLEDEIKVKKEALVELNKTEFDIEEFKKLSYEEAKEVFEAVQYNLDYKEQRKQVEEVLKKLKEDTFEILKVAHYYPIINQFNYLTDTQKNVIDSFLYKVGKGSYIHTRSQGWYRLRLSDEIESKLFNDLYEKGIFEKAYQLICSHCNEYMKIISEEEYLNQKKMFDIFDRHRENKATDEEIQWCEDLMENGGRIWEISCLDCEDEYQEIESFEQLENRAKIIYKLKADPDLTYARK